MTLEAELGWNFLLVEGRRVEWVVEVVQEEGEGGRVGSCLPGHEVAGDRGSREAQGVEGGREEARVHLDVPAVEVVPLLLALAAGKEHLVDLVHARRVAQGIPLGREVAVPLGKLREAGDVLVFEGVLPLPRCQRTTFFFSFFSWCV